MRRCVLRATRCGVACLGWVLLHGVVWAADLSGAVVLSVKGRVEIARAGSAAWDAAASKQVLGPGDRLRTLEHARATLRLRDATVVPVDELTTLRVDSGEGRSVIEILRGVLSFFHRDASGDVEVRGGGASAIIRGTEFAVSVDGAGRLTLALFDGEVEVTNRLGRVVAGAGDAVTVDEQAAPRRSPGVASTDRSILQWSLYYPAVLDPSDVVLGGAERGRWEGILAMYRAGELWNAFSRAEELGEPSGDGERLLRAGLCLAVGDLGGFERFGAGIRTGSGEGRLLAAMAEVIRAVQVREVGSGWLGRVVGATEGESSATELMAASYCLQSQGRLMPALTLAQRAVRRDGAFGPAHVRVAELEFAMGRVGSAGASLARALELSPRHAAALSLGGFLDAARERFDLALGKLDAAIAADPALGDAWLGRGLVRLRTGDRTGGRIDVETAAALEPARSVLRSYLGKAFAEEGDDLRALEELGRARSLDPTDPTSWLYAALLHYRRYELAEAIRSLEESAARNEHRAIYRSRLLLDQDAAVRGANLAKLYDMADMADVSRRESARAVMADYANASAHLNLASSFNALRDPTRFHLRNETVWFNEHLLASLLAPTESAPLSQNLSQNEYSRLFARSRVGINTTTEYFSQGEWRQLTSQTGNFERFSYALDLDYHRQPGFRPNQDLSRVEWYSRAKFDLSSQDSALLLTKYEDYESGDNFQYLDPSRARLQYRLRESQQPIVLGGLHREWSPGSHSLVLGGRLENAQEMSDRAADQLVGFGHPLSPPATAPMDLAYQNRFEIYSIEGCHILQGPRWDTVVGGRFQAGDFHARSVLDATPSGFPELFGTNVVTLGDGAFQRGSAYGYQTWEVIEELRVTGGVSYDAITAPRNFRRPPLQAGEQSSARWSPKAALTWTPVPSAAVRGMYAESLGGVSYDESVRLEPTQLAGFVQAFRTLIPESLVGSVETPRHRSAGLGIDLKASTRTYVGLEGRWMESHVDQAIGFFHYDAFRPAPEAIPDSTPRNLGYRERGIRSSLNQILGKEWFAQAMHTFTRAEFESALPLLPAPADFQRLERQQADIHQISGSILYQRPGGWFAKGTVVWTHQDDVQSVHGGSEDFAQVNVFAGYRFPRHMADVTVGLLNLGGDDYALHPLGAWDALPRQRSLYIKVHISL